MKNPLDIPNFEFEMSFDNNFQYDDYFPENNFDVVNLI